MFKSLSEIIIPLIFIEPVKQSFALGIHPRLDAILEVYEFFPCTSGQPELQKTRFGEITNVLGTKARSTPTTRFHNRRRDLSASCPRRNSAAEAPEPCPCHAQAALRPALRSMQVLENVVVDQYTAARLHGLPDLLKDYLRLVVGPVGYDI